MPIPTSIEDQIKALNLGESEAPVLASLTELRQAYITIKDSELASLQARWDAATAIQAKAGDENQAAMDALTERLAITTAERDALATLRDTMTERVSAVLQSGDPAQYVALAAEFLTPAVEKERAQLLAAQAEISAKLAQLPPP